MFIKFIMVKLFSLTIALSSFYRKETDSNIISFYRKNKGNINMIAKKFKYRHKKIKKHNILINKINLRKIKQQLLFLMLQIMNIFIQVLFQ